MKHVLGYFSRRKIYADIVSYIRVGKQCKDETWYWIHPLGESESCAESKVQFGGQVHLGVWILWYFLVMVMQVEINLQSEVAGLPIIN